MGRTSEFVWVHDPDDIVEFSPDGEQIIAFDKATGETHFLNELSALVLQCVTRDGCSLDALLESLQQWSGTQLDSGAVSKVRFALKVLEDAELVDYRPVDRVECER